MDLEDKGPCGFLELVLIGFILEHWIRRNEETDLSGKFTAAETGVPIQELDWLPVL